MYAFRLYLKDKLGLSRVSGPAYKSFVRKKLILIALLIEVMTGLMASAAIPVSRRRSEEAYRQLEDARGHQRVDILNRLSVYRLNDSTLRALELNREAISLAIESGDRGGLADAWLIRARCLFPDPTRNDSCLHYLRLSHQLKRNLNDSSGLELVYQHYGRLSLRNGDPATALLLFDTAATMARRVPDLLRQARIYNEMADCQIALGNNDRAMSLLDRSWSVYRSSTDTADLGSFLLTLGVSFSDIGQKEMANEAYLLSARYAELAGDSLSLAYALANLSDLCHTHTYREKGGEYALRALDIFRSIGNERGMAYALNSLGQYAFDSKEYNTALIYYLEAARLKENSGDIQGACFVHCNLSELYAIMGSYPAALAELEHAEGLCNRIGDGLCETVIFHAYGNYYSLRKDHEKARQYYLRSLQSAEGLSLHDFVTDNLAAISEQYQAEGRPEQALEFYKRYTATRDSASRNINLMNMAELLVRYESEKKDNLLKEMMGSGQRRSFLFGNLAIILVLMIALVVIMFRMNLIGGNRLLPGLLLAFRNPATPGIRTPADRAAKPAITLSRQEAIWNDLQKLMDEDRLYLNSRLKLSDLADHLNTNTTYLSMVINEMTRDNFCNYLNHLRIKEAQKLLREPGYKNLTIEAIAQAVGFNSKSAFNSAFKKHLSITPREYISSTSPD